MFNISYRKVGGLRFIKLGRITLMFCVSKHRPKPVINRQTQKEIGAVVTTEPFEPDWLDYHPRDGFMYGNTQDGYHQPNYEED